MKRWLVKKFGYLSQKNKTTHVNFKKLSLYLKCKTFNMYFNSNLQNSLLVGERGKPFSTSLYRVERFAPRLIGFNISEHAKRSTRLTTASSTRKQCAS